MDVDDKTVSIPMFNLLCIQARLKSVRCPVGTLGEAREDLMVIADLVNEAIYELDKQERQVQP